MNPPAISIVALAFVIVVMAVTQRNLDDRIAQLAKDNQSLRDALIREMQNHTKCIEKNIELLRQLEEIKYPKK